ncbi:hypothetical protein M0802_009960 [Mischocyttarus mexicanus]|nr:hypothetical protein M0802_009960 [Mischocyttarus mexicanus]
MENDSEDAELSSKFLKALKVKGKSFGGFDDGIKALQHTATTKGLSDKNIDQLIYIVTHLNFGAVKNILLIKCLVPIYKISNEALKLMLTWLLSSLNNIQITVVMITIQWIIGVWEYCLADKKIISMFYEVFFYWLTKKEKLEKHLAQVLYTITKPEDVTRRNVSRILSMQKRRNIRSKYTNALLSLCKTYKPELVPEKIETMNIESIWKPIPEVLRVALKDAKNRLEMQQSIDKIQEHFKWNLSKVSKKKNKLLLPSVGYFHIGSSIFKDKDAKSIFDIYTTDDLGQHHLSIELPCNAISLLVNTAGYHLLTYTDFNFQIRFAYNLYNTLRRAFILEKDNFSETEMETLLDMTVQFCKYMQQGILVVNHFIEEYLYLNNREHFNKILELLQWMTIISVNEEQQAILPYIKNMFYESSITDKCKIIETLRILITNIYVNEGFFECCQKVPAPFLRQKPMGKITETIPILINFSENLMISGLNAHSYNPLLLSESLTFYEVIFELESGSNILLRTVIPAALTYGAFVSKNCAIVSRICSLLLRYLKRYEVPEEKNIKSFNENTQIVSAYITDIAGALWYDKAFDSINHYLCNTPTTNDFGKFNFHTQLNINNHYAILPYKYIIPKEILNSFEIVTKEDAINLAGEYYPAIRKFLKRVIPELKE